jgi:hypothetical protein
MRLFVLQPRVGERPARELPQVVVRVHQREILPGVHE